MIVDATYMIKQLKTCLHDKKYRKLINRVQTYFDMQPKLDQIGGQLICKILLLQTKAICKLLQKNNYKKNPYKFQFYSQLISLCQRNLAIIYSSLQDKMKQFHLVWNIYDQNQSFIKQMNVKPFKFKNNSEKEFKNFLDDFFQIVLKVYLYNMINIKRYQLQKEKLNQYGKSCVLLNTLFLNKFLILQTSIKLFSAINDFENTLYKKSQQKIQLCIDFILQSLLLISAQYHQEQFQKKRRYLQKKLYRFLILSFVCSIKNKIQLNQESLAQQQINMFFSLLKNLETYLMYTRRMLAIDILNFQFFITYRQQKSQIIAILNKIYEGTDILQKFQPSKVIKKDIVDFYNHKMYSMQKQKAEKQKIQRQSIKMSEEKGKKTLIIQPRKNTLMNHDLNRGINSLKKMTNSFIRQSQRRSTFRKDTGSNFMIVNIFNQIEKLTGNFLCSRSLKPANKNINQQNEFFIPKDRKTDKSYFNTTRFAEKKTGRHTFSKKFTQRTSQPKKGQLSFQNVIQTTKIDKDYANFEKKRLKRKKIQNKTQITATTPTPHQYFKNDQQIKRQVQMQSNILLNTNIRQNIQIIKLQQNQKIVEQQNIKNVSHTQWFTSLIIKNKQYLGLKKLIQKIQYARKKKQLREKARGSRNQSVDATMRGLKKYSYIASQLLKHSMYFGIDQKNIKTLRPNFRNIEQQQNLRQLNFEIGQNTIDNMAKLLQQKLQQHKMRQQKQRRKLSRKPLVFNFIR